MEAGPQLEQRRDLAVDADRPLVRPQDARHALQQRALARAVLTDEPERRSFRDLERHVLQGEELLVAGTAAAHDRGLEALVALVVEPEPLRHVIDDDHVTAGVSVCVGRHYNSSARRPSNRRNTKAPTTSVAIDTTTRYAMLPRVGQRRSYKTLR